MFTENIVVPPPPECPLDVVFVMDESGSIGSTNYEKMKDFVSDLVAGMDVDSGNTRVGLVTFANSVKTTINLNEHTTLASLQSAISALTHGGGKTYTNLALEYVRAQMLTEAAGDRSNVSNVVVILTDGRSTDPSLTEVSVK